MNSFESDFTEEYEMYELLISLYAFKNYGKNNGATRGKARDMIGKLRHCYGKFWYIPIMNNVLNIVPNEVDNQKSLEKFIKNGF